MMAVPPPDQDCVMNNDIGEEAPSPRCLHHCLSPTSLASHLESDEGIDCYGNEREFLTDQAKFYNNKLLSDVILLVENTTFFAHKFVLVRASQVFERMFTSKQWDSHKEREVKLVEDNVCVSVFPQFLGFLYSCHVKLNIDNTLPILILSDKYNVADLRNVCLDFACFYIIPKVQLKDVFHVWFQYATKCYHHRLTKACVEALAQKMDEIVNSAEWEPEWLSLDRDQLLVILGSSCLVVKDEYNLWQAVLKWLETSQHNTGLPDGQFAALLASVLEHVRFPMMTPDQLNQVELCPVLDKHKALFHPQLMLAYKYHALPLCTRSRTKDFTTKSFLLRNYIDTRWDKRIVVPRLSSIPRGTEVSIRFSTCACWSPAQTWEWELRIQPKGSNQNPDDVRAVLYSNVLLDQPRAVEFFLSVVDNNSILHAVSGRKNFTKARYSSDTEIEKKVSVSELLQPSSPFVVDDALLLQICLRPAH